jgi:flagellar biosynthetic protein FliR
VTITLSGEPFIAFVLAGVRVLAWLMLVPPFSSRSVPGVAKALLAVGLTFTLAPSLTMLALPTDVVQLAGYAIQEALIGATMGFVTYLLFAAVQAAGDLIDVFGGFSLAMAFDPMSFNTNSVFGKLYQMLALLTKVAPMLNAIGIMFPAKIGLTLLVVGLSFPVLPEAMSRLLEAISDAMGAVG